MPLLVLTADRPPELRDLGAGQTIDQVKLYGSAAKWFLEVDAHAGHAGAAAVAAPARVPRVLDRASRGAPGPVHLNFSLREPLVLDEPLGADDRRASRRAALGHTAADRRRAAATTLVDGLRRRAPGAPARSARGRPRGARPAARRRARRVRRTRGDPAAAPTRCPARAAGLPPSRTTTRCCATTSGRSRTRPTSCSGSATCRPPSRCASGCTALDDALQIAFDPEGAWQDPAGAVATILPPTRATTLEAVGGGLKRRRDSAWLDRWRHADRSAAEAIARALSPAGLSEPRVAAELGHRAAAGGDRGRRVVDAGARRGDVLPGARAAAAGARQPRRQRYRRDRLDRLRGRRGRRRSRRAPHRRRRADP